MMNYGYGQVGMPWSYAGNAAYFGGATPYSQPPGVGWMGAGYPGGFGCGFPATWGAMAPFGAMYGGPSWPGFGAYPYAPSTSWGATVPIAPLGDDELREFVEAAIDNDPAIPSNANIEVNVRDGVVTLTGTVPNKRIKHAAGDDAWWISQVIDVHNEIEVAPRRERVSRSTGEAKPSIAAATRGRK